MRCCLQSKTCIRVFFRPALRSIKNEQKNFLKNKKINWIKVVIQILSFALIPGLFEGEFAAVGNIVSCIYKGNISWESVKYSVWMLLATVPATVLVGRFFCGFFCSFGAVQDLLWLGSHRLRAFT